MREGVKLPAIHRLIAAVPELPAPLVKAAARALVAEVRGGASAPPDWAGAVRARVAAAAQPTLRRVINATGVVLHTNLGRAPLSAAVAARVAAAAEGYLNLELDLETGQRGERLGGVKARLAGLCGAESAVAVNNNAAAVLLMLTALTAGREVIVSRGELVEIGGAFRVPDVITAGGARLVEVGTTNRTRAADYARAITPQTAAILLVHPSNFSITGFTERPERAALAALAKERGLLLLEDLGSGALTPGLGEPTVPEVLAAGVDVACFSGDKLFGGPQAGLAVGRAALIQQMRRHPLYRALRLDRLVLAALEATLQGWEAGEAPLAIQLLQQPLPALAQRAASWQARLKARGVEARVVKDQSRAGGGSLPGEGVETWAVAIPGRPGRSEEAILAALRRGRAPVLARAASGEVRLDPRTVLPAEEEALLTAVVDAVLPAKASATQAGENGI